jgi:hypothetical protein
MDDCFTEGQSFQMDSHASTILTADNLASRGLQHSPSCPLCNSNPEDARHLLINCIFAREVHRLVWSWFHFLGMPTNCSTRLDPARWLAASATRVKPANVRLATRILLYSWWNVWKERKAYFWIHSAFRISGSLCSEGRCGDVSQTYAWVPAAIVFCWCSVRLPFLEVFFSRGLSRLRFPSFCVFSFCQPATVVLSFVHVFLLLRRVSRWCLLLDSVFCFFLMQGTCHFPSKKIISVCPSATDFLYLVTAICLGCLGLLCFF